MRTRSIVKERQLPLCERYIREPESAWITDVAVVEGKYFEKPFHTEVSINEELEQKFGVGVHRALGGFHDLPNPGDILCASLASCFESTLRMIANRLGIKLTYTKVKAEAHVDVRGTLMINKDIPVAFQSMDLKIEIATEANDPKLIRVLLKATENSCVIYQTLSRGIPVNIHHEILKKTKKVKIKL